MEKDTSSPDLAESAWRFSTKLYNILKENGGNLVVSPISLQLVSAMAYLGAKGDTAKEMQDGLMFHPDEKTFLTMHNSFLLKLTFPELSTANKIFIEKTYNVKPDFTSKCEKYFLSSLQMLDFVNESEPSRTHINSWVEEKTKNKIKNLLEQGTIDEYTRLVLVNAVHFKAKWKHAFPPSSTVPLPFFITPTDSVDVPMMNIKKRFNYFSCDEIKAQFLQLPYQNEAFSLLIILPHEKDGLAQVEETLSEYQIEGVFDKMRNVEVQVTLPKFKIESTFDLKEAMMKMGMSTMFGNDADFSGIFEPHSDPLCVSKVIQKAFIEVNEEGTEAAAATGAVMMVRAAFFIVDEVLADHPFMYWLVMNKTPLFVGSVRDASDLSNQCKNQEEDPVISSIIHDSANALEIFEC